MASRSSDAHQRRPAVQRCAAVHTRCAFTPAGVLAVVQLCVLAFSVSALGQDTDLARTEARARRATERLQELQQEADHLASEEGTLLGDLRKLEIQREITAEELRQTVAAATAVANALAATDARVRQLQE